MECYLHQKSMDVGGYVTVKIHSLGLLPDAIGCLRASCSSKPPWPFAWPFLEVISGSEDMTYLKYHTSWATHEDDGITCLVPNKSSANVSDQSGSFWDVTHVLTDGERTGWLNVYHRPEGESIFPSFQTLHGHRPDFSVMKYSTMYSWNGDHWKIRWKMR